MFNRTYLPDLILASVAIGAALVLAVFMLVFEYSPSAKASELLQSNCRGEESFYLPSQLYNEEATNYSQNAKAFSFLSSSGVWMRVISDYTLSRESNDLVYSITLKSSGSNKIDFAGSKIELRFDDGESRNLLEDINSHETGILTVKGSRTAPENLQAELILSSENGYCQGIIPNVLMVSSVSSENPDEIGVVSGNQTGEYTFASGYTPVGFSGWRYLKPFTDEGLTFLRFDRSNNSWVLNPQNESYFAEPGIAYLVYNPSPNPTKVNSTTPFFVPPTVDDHQVAEGWNFLYNDTGNDILSRDIKLTLSRATQPSRAYIEDKVSLEELIKEGRADKNILFLPKGYDGKSLNLKNIDLTLSTFNYVIPDSSFFWVYIYDDSTSQRAKNIELSSELKGGGDTFSSNQYIQFEQVITNQSEQGIIVPDGSRDDPCLAGLEFTDSEGNIIESDADDKECPLWPKTTTLNKGESISYNYSWKPKEKIRGEIIVRSYFDYTRLGASDMLYNETKVNIQ